MHRLTNYHFFPEIFLDFQGPRPVLKPASNSSDEQASEVGQPSNHLIPQLFERLVVIAPKNSTLRLFCLFADLFAGLLVCLFVCKETLKHDGKPGYIKTSTLLGAPWSGGTIPAAASTTWGRSWNERGIYQGVSYKCWVSPTNKPMGFPTKKWSALGVWNGEYHHLRKHHYQEHVQCLFHLHFWVVWQLAPEKYNGWKTTFRNWEGLNFHGASC